MKPLGSSFVLSILLILPAWLLLSSCNDTSASRHEGVPAHWPKQINFAYTPSSEDPVASETRWKERVKYMSDYLGIPVKLFETSSYGPTIEAMKSGKVDISTIGSFSFMIAAEKAGVEPIICTGKRNEDGTVSVGNVRTIIAVPADSPYNTMEDLINDSANVIFAFSDAASTTGHLIPRSGLIDMGIDPEEDFERVVYTQSNLNTMMTVVAGKVDAGGFQESYFGRNVMRGRVSWDQIKILWKSKPYLRPPVMVRGDLPRDLKEAIRNSYLDMEERAPELYASRVERYKIYYGLDMAYVPVYDYMWDGMREMAARLENMKLIEGRTGITDWDEEDRAEYIRNLETPRKPDPILLFE